MAKKKNKTLSPESPNLLHTLDQTSEAQKSSRRLSELPDLKQHPGAPKIAGYILLKPIGQGAYAEVWEAVQLRTRKFVAVKVFTKKSGVHWFYLQREADRLGRLDKHPNIVSLLDADLGGETPYYVMDLMQEGSLDRRLQSEKDLGTDQAAEWMEEIAQALSYVHAKQMVHCDLKPANVLLDDEGRVRVADFGHSRVLSDSGGSLGTLFFMAPEQAVLPDQAGALQPNVQWDVYSLGCTAYALLINRVPHGEIGGRLEAAADLGEKLRIYREAVEQHPVPELYVLTRGRVDRDLSAIIAKCMKTRPEERYASAQEVLKDLKNRRTGRPVSPLARDKGYWIGKFVLRYRTSVLTALVALAAVLTAFSFVLKHQRAQVRDTAFNYVLRGKAFLDKDDAASAAAYFAASDRLSPSLLARGNLALHLPPIPARYFPHDGGVSTVLYSPDGRILLTAGGSWARLWNAETGQSLGRALRPGGDVTAAAFSPDGTRLVLGDSKGAARLYEVPGQRPVGRALRHDKEITSVCFSPDGRKVLTAGADGAARVWDAATGGPLKPVLRQGQALYRACFSPDGEKIMTAGKDGTVRLWDAGDGHSLCKPVQLVVKGAPSWYRPSAAFDPDGRHFMTAAWDGGVRFYDLHGRRWGRILFLEGVGAHALLSPDGRRLLTSVVFEGSLGVARLWDARTRSPGRFNQRSAGRFTVLAFSPDGKEILTGSEDHSARLWDADSGDPLGPTLWHGDTVSAAAFQPGGESVVTGCKNGLACLWDREGEDPEDRAELGWKKSGRARFRRLLSHALFSPDLKKILTYGGRTACLWDAETGEAEGRVMEAGGILLRALFSPDGSRLLTCDMDNEARLWNLETGEFKVLPQKGAVHGGAFSSDGRRLATGGDDKTLKFWDPATGKEWGMPISTGFPIANVFLSRDGKRAAVLGRERSFALYPVEKDGPKPLAFLDRGVRSLDFSPDGRKLLLAEGRTAVVLDAETGRKLRTLDEKDWLVSVLMSPDNRTAATFGSDGTVRLWDVGTGLPVGNPLKREGPVQESDFSPSGGVLLLAYQDGGWQLWDARTGESIGEEMRLGSAARAVGFDPGGKGLALLGRDDSLTRVAADWMDPGTDPDRLLTASELAGWCRVDGEGSLEPVSADQWVGLWKQYRKGWKP